MSGIQEDLFELIQSLSVSEKRYFKVFASSGSKSSEANNYVVLFDVLSDLDSYEENVLLKKLGDKLKDHSKNLRAQLNQDMQYLYKVLLQSMRQYQNKASHIQIRDMTSDAILLRDRGLYRQAERRIIKAKELAKKYHNYAAQLALNRLERTLIWTLNDVNQDEKTALLIQEKNDILQVLEEEMAYEDLYALVSNAVNRQNLFLTDKEKAAALVAQRDTLLSKKAPEQLPAFVQLRYYQITAAYAIAENKMQEGHEHIKKMLQWWETHADLKEEEFFRYQISLSKAMTFLFNNGMFEELIQLIRKAREEKNGKINSDAGRFHYTLIMNELLYYLNARKLDEAKTMLPSVMQGINQYTHVIKRKIALCYNAALVCFFNNDFRYCEEWLLKITAHARTNIRKDLSRKAFLLRVLLSDHDEEAQKKAIQAAKKYFKADEEEKNPKVRVKEKFMPIEQEILGLITKVLHAPPTYREQKEHLEKLSAYLKNATSNPQAGRLERLDEFSIWCESKLRRKTVREIFLELAE